MVEIAVQWSPNEVSQWLEAIGLPMYCHAFLEHEISGTELMSLERSDFKDVGVSKVTIGIIDAVTDQIFSSFYALKSIFSHSIHHYELFLGFYSLECSIFCVLI